MTASQPAPTRIASGPGWTNAAPLPTKAASHTESPAVTITTAARTPANPASEAPLPDGADLSPLRPDPGTDPAPFTAPRQETARTEGPRLDLPRAETPRSETAAQIARQIADALTRTETSTFDLVLDPEELGQVRMRLQLHEGVSLLTIHADRPDTLDLMRRHIATLEQDLRAQGHESLSLRFSGGSPQGEGQARGQGNSGASGPDRGTPQPASLAERSPSPARVGQSDRLDLRL